VRIADPCRGNGPDGDGVDRSYRVSQVAANEFGEIYVLIAKEIRISRELFEFKFGAAEDIPKTTSPYVNHGYCSRWFYWVFSNTVVESTAREGAL